MSDLRGHYRDHGPLACKVYVGDVGPGAARHDLEDAFGYYGPLKNVWVARNPPGFAFIEFEDPRDAEDAVRGMDGRNICGRRVRVEMSSGETRRSRRMPPPARRAGHGERCYECGKPGHYARDCRPRGQYHSRKRSRSPSPRRSYSPRRYSRSKSRSRSRSRSPDNRRRRKER
ncbi:serine/arginine-rich splicing factor 7-like isoform X2 [Anneissia japonica]|uniref:serine/arginine-rich splicing factor 7-like isoform X2 n=1 Tax=Anneissia japonica TaxID=1529436 RepID=UPI0014259823|nr:serine/arginine-rich splicing factor 7-like isoform X2 [Anneissia japonica]